MLPIMAELFEWVSQRQGYATFDKSETLGVSVCDFNIEKNVGYLHAHMLIFTVTFLFTSEI
jgi:hypothetical protein